MKIASTHAEQYFLPITSLGQLADLRRRLKARGNGRARIAGCIDFLIALDHGDDLPDPALRTQYRKMLHELVELEGPDGAKDARKLTRATPGYLSSLGRRRGNRRSSEELNSLYRRAA